MMCRVQRSVDGRKYFRFTQEYPHFLHERIRWHWHHWTAEQRVKLEPPFPVPEDQQVAVIRAAVEWWNENKQASVQKLAPQ